MPEYGMINFEIHGKTLNKNLKENIMDKKKNKTIDFSKMKPEELVKYEVAKELGLYERVIKDGWGSLSAKETGRIGGLITKRKKVEKL